MQDNNEENNQNLEKDFFKAESSDNPLESTSSNLFTVSEDVNPLTTDVNKVEQKVTSKGIIGEKERPKGKRAFFSRKSILDTDDEDSKYLKSYIGKNHSKITKEIVNYAAIIFSPFYYAYRKLIVLGIIIFCGVLFLHLKLNNFFYDGLLYVISGFFFNIIYVAYCVRKVNKIKRRYEKYDSYSIDRICDRKGGTSVVFLILSTLIYLIIFVFYCANFYLAPTSKFLEKFGIVFTYDNGKIEFRYDENLLNPDEILDDKYGFKSKDYFNMGIPNSHFIETENNNNYLYVYTLGKESQFDMCRIELLSTKGYSSSTKLIEAISRETKEEIQNITVNNINWQYIHHNGLKGTNYYYTTMIDDKVFLLNYFKDNSGIYDCLDYEKDVLESIKKK